MGSRLLPLSSIDWNDALVLCAFPTTGSVSSIAGHYLQRKLELPLVGSFIFDDQSPVVAVRAGQVSAPVRVFGGEVVCSLPKGECPRILLVMSDLPMREGHVRPLAEAILAAAAGARLVLCLDGVIREEGDDTPDVFSAAASPAVLADLDVEGTEPLGDAILAGVTAEMLLQGAIQERAVAALVVEAAQHIPDGRAAAALITIIDRMVASVVVDAKPLLEEALELERQILKAQRNAERQAPRPTPGTGSFI